MPKTEFPDPPEDWYFWEIGNFNGLRLELKSLRDWSRWHFFGEFFVYDEREYEHKKLLGFIPVFRFRVVDLVIWTKLEEDNAAYIRGRAEFLLEALKKRELRKSHLVGKYPPKKLSDWENA